MASEEPLGDPPARDSRAALRRRLGRAFLILAAAALLAAAAGAWMLQGAIERPHAGFREGAVVDIPRGAGLAAIANRLETAGVVSSGRLFRWYSRWRGLDTRLHAGEYLFDAPVSMRQTLDKLARGEVRLHKTTLPEGLDLEETADHLARLGWGDRERFMKAFADSSPIRDLDAAAADLEGYLLPETYFFPRGADEAEIASVLVSAFRGLWNESRRQRALQLGLGLRETVTLASLIEEETALPEERRLVSSVFHNRLRRGIKLDCDPTVIYAVKRAKGFDGIIHRSDLEFDSPYNTYLYPGLPPGPISSPGAASIDAALDPAPSDYLFFVSRNDGSHVFSRTYREHRRAVKRYQR